MAMKNLPASLLTTLVLASASALLVAQEATPAPSSSFGLTPGKPDSILPPGAGDLPLMPDGSASLDHSPLGGSPSPARTPKPSVTDVAEDALRDRLKVRAARTKAQREPDLQAIWDRALVAKTDYEQRELFLEYYKKFCERVGKFDKTIGKDTLDALYSAYTARFNQTRIKPTEKPIAKSAR